MEYLTAEVLELAGITAREKSGRRRKRTITPSHLKEAVWQDEELDSVFHTVIIPGGGVKVTVEKDDIREWDSKVRKPDRQVGGLDQ